MSDDPFLYEFARELHKDEFDRKDKHDTTDGFLLAVVSILGSVGVYYLGVMPDNWQTIPSVVFIACAIVFGGFFAASLLFVTRSIVPRDIGYLPDPKEVKEYIDNLDAFYRSTYNFGQVDETAIEAKIKEDIRRTTMIQYFRCADVNRRSNHEKQVLQTWAKRYIALAVFMMVLNAIPTFLVQRAKDEVTRVQIIKEKAPETKK